ncbi:MAG TPA: DNA-3-methyladenine glycosylase 2 family protein [Candidatus Competibacteraceae bacterium]|nr:DNA-3-methyladenine glycosylase 2 family protein [Candidatus Competibacteraceae bacterium]
MTLAYDPDEALRALTAADRRLAALVERIGPFRLQLNPCTDTFAALLEAVVSQQLSGRAAATLHGRLLALFPDRQPAPQRLLALSDEALRGTGVSRNKILALRDLAAKTLDGTVLPLQTLHHLDDDSIVRRLSSVRGIGRWTVQMLLIFQLGRPDVWPVDDLGIRKGYQRAFGLAEPPKPRELVALGESWRPWRSVASWYLWRALELPAGD